MAWQVYILQCADETLYVGITNRLQDRIANHNAGKGAKYTKGRIPVTLAYWEEVADKSTALKRELRLKKLSRKGKLALIYKARGNKVAADS